jgi:hypothetical protein
LLMVKKYLLLYFQSLFCNRTHKRQVAEAPCKKNHQKCDFNVRHG